MKKNPENRLRPSGFFSIRKVHRYFERFSRMSVSAWIFFSL